MDSRVVRALPTLTLGLATMALVAYAFGRVTRSQWVWWLAPLTVAVDGSLLLRARPSDRAALVSFDGRDLEACITLASSLVSSGMAAWGAFTANRMALITGAALAILGRSLDSDTHEPHSEPLELADASVRAIAPNNRPCWNGDIVWPVAAPVSDTRRDGRDAFPRSAMLSSVMHSPVGIGAHQQRARRQSMKLYTYLNYGGTCRQAFEFYVQHLGGKITEITTHGELPGTGDVPPDWRNAVVHARMELGDTMLLGADIPPDRFQPMRSAYLTLILDSIEEAERIYGLLTDGGQIFMPMEETFFARRFAMLRDRFGTSWMLLHEHAPAS